MKDFMIEKREALGLTVCEMAGKCLCSRTLLEMLEESDRHITHPHIAARIAKAYGLSVDEYNRLVSAKHRTNKLPKAKKPPTESNLSVAFIGKYENPYRKYQKEASDP
ncbi:MAG: helix-turn-helix domain-containing protein [Clostridiales bacterium]|nr:helix-turn-helix domain-containing protein [Clostridiales bacterium]